MRDNHHTAEIEHGHMEEEHGHCHCDSDHAHCCHGHEEHMHVDTVGEIDPDLAGQASESRALFRIPNMDCPMEEALIRKKLATVPGIRDLNFNLMQRLLTVDHEPGNVPQIIAALDAIDMHPEELKKDAPRALDLTETRIPWIRLAIAVVLALFSEFFELMAEWHDGMAALQVAGWPIAEWLALGLAIAAIGLGGLATFRKGWLAVSNFNLNINALMAVAVTGAVLIGQFPEAAMVMVLFNISEAIEAMALDKARKDIKKLMDLAPEMVTARDAQGNWREMPVEDIASGMLIRVRPGEKIGLDGVIVSGHSDVNQAPITGESVPVEKDAGDQVFGGTINGSGSFEFRVTAAASETTLARIIHTVEEAQASRAPMQRFVDVFAKYYTPCVFILALLWALLLPLLFGWEWRQSIYTGLVLLVIGCPCALVISTPVTVVSGLAAATRKGVLIKGGLYLEQGRRLNWLALDKTGTITSGEPKLRDVIMAGAIPEEEAKMLAVALASRSDHPVSRAIATAPMAADVKSAEVSDFTAITGKGVSGRINGRLWHLGSVKLVDDLDSGDKAIKDRIIKLEQAGNTVVALVGEKGVAALFAVADTVRETSVEAIRELNALNVKTMMLTGDNEHTARAIAAEVGVEEFRANLMPEDKLEIIGQLEKDGNVVGMAGDGINDAPALAKANIGFAMAGAGTDTAMEVADVAIMDDDLRKIPRFIRLSRATQTILMENIIVALAIKAIFFGLTLTGNATMWMAVFADVGAALIVVGNGLRIMRK